MKTLSTPTDSIALNWGDNQAAVDEFENPLEWDQRGNGDPRYALGITDIGAFEIQPQIRMEVDTDTIDDVRGCTPRTADCSLSGAIALVNASPRHQRVTFARDICDKEFKLPPLLTPLREDLVVDATNCPQTLVITGGPRDVPAHLQLINIELSP